MKAEQRLVVSAPMFAVPAELVRELEAARERQKTRWQLPRPDAIERARDAFLLDPGLGPATYLTRTGCIVWDDDMWGVEGTRAEALAAIVAGARKTGVRALLDLLPQRDEAASECADCTGTGLFRGGRLRDVHGEPVFMLCMACAGLGWVSPTLPLGASVLGG